MYLFHYVFVVWLQYALLGAALLAIAKAMIVFGGTRAPRLGDDRHLALRSARFATHRGGATDVGERAIVPREFGSRKPI